MPMLIARLPAEREPYEKTVLPPSASGTRLSAKQPSSMTVGNAGGMIVRRRMATAPQRASVLGLASRGREAFSWRRRVVAAIFRRTTSVVNDGKKIVKVEWFFENLENVGLPGVCHQFAGGEAGDQNRFHAGKRLLEPLNDIQPRHVISQHPIRNKNIGPKNAGDPKGLFARPGGLYFVAFFGQTFAKCFAILCFVVNDKHTRHGSYLSFTDALFKGRLMVISAPCRLLRLLA